MLSLREEEKFMKWPDIEKAVNEHTSTSRAMNKEKRRLDESELRMLQDFLLVWAFVGGVSDPLRNEWRLVRTRNFDRTTKTISYQWTAVNGS